MAGPPSLGIAGIAVSTEGGEWCLLCRAGFWPALSLPGEFVDTDKPAAAAFLERMRISRLPPPPTRPLAYAQVVCRPSPGLATAEYVYVRRCGAGPPLPPLYAGPFQVIPRKPKFFKLKMGGKEEVISIDRLKPHLGPLPVDPASPPRRGRPALPPSSSSASTLGGGSCSGFYQYVMCE